MKEYTAIVEQDSKTGLYVGYITGFPGAHSQADTLDELNTNLREDRGVSTVNQIAIEIAKFLLP